jgi:hypothetical protein
LLAIPWQAAAAPVEANTYAIGKCFDTTRVLEQRPATFVYNCDQTGVMQDMT